MKLLRPLLLSLVAVGLLASPALARKGGFGGGGPEPTEEQQAVHALQKQIAAVELVQVLALDAAQVATLREIVPQILAAQEARHAEAAADAPAIKKVLQGYLAELKKTGQPSQKSVDALAAFQADKKADRDGAHESMRALHGQLRDLLTDQQRQAMADFEPSVRLGPDQDERKERRMERREERGERGERGDRRERGHRGDRGDDGDEGPDGRGFDSDEGHGERGERGERMERRMKHQKARMLVRHLLLSQELLDALN